MTKAIELYRYIWNIDSLWKKTNDIITKTIIELRFTTNLFANNVFFKAYLISFNSRQIAWAKFTVCCPSSFISLKHNGLFEIKNHQFNRRDTVPFEISARSLLYKICIGEEFQMFTYTRHSWPLNRKSSLACHTFCDKGQTLIWSFKKTQWSCLYD